MPNTEQSIQETGGIPVIELEMEVSGMTQYPVDRTLSIQDMAADAKETGDALADLAADIASIASQTYPVGSIYMTVNDELPSIITSMGTWIEIMLPLTWNDIKTGSRGYVEKEIGVQTGTVHFWLRTA